MQQNSPILFYLVLPILFLLFPTIALTSCKKKTDEPVNTIAVFIPGVIKGHPAYEMLDAGIRAAAKEADLPVNTVEGGYDSATWESQLNALASEGSYNLIVSTTPTINDMAIKINQNYPNQDFLIFDGSGQVSGRVSDVVYRRAEQAFLIGYFAGMATTDPNLGSHEKNLRVGFIAAKGYPHLTTKIRPAFEIGLHTINPDIQLEFREMENWSDTEVAHSTAAKLYESGINVILTIAGSANQGVIDAAKEVKKHVLWFDSDGSRLAPGTILASAVIRQQEAARYWCSEWIDEHLAPGESVTVGVRENYVDFPVSSRQFRRHVPKTIIQEMTRLLDTMQSGELNLETLEAGNHLNP